MIKSLIYDIIDGRINDVSGFIDMIRAGSALSSYLEGNVFDIWDDVGIRIIDTSMADRYCEVDGQLVITDPSHPIDIVARAKDLDLSFMMNKWVKHCYSNLKEELELFNAGEKYLFDYKFNLEIII